MMPRVRDIPWSRERDDRFVYLILDFRLTKFGVIKWALLVGPQEKRGSPSPTADIIYGIL